MKFLVFYAFAAWAASVRAFNDSLSKCLSHDLAEVCFAPLIKEGVYTPVMASEIQADGYAEFGYMRFATVEVEKHPLFLCDHLDAVVTALDCSKKEAKATCPFLDDSHFTKQDRVTVALSFLCSRKKDLDNTCMPSLSTMIRECQKTVQETVKTRFPSDKTKSKSQPPPEPLTDKQQAIARERLNEILCLSEYLMAMCVNNSIFRECKSKPLMTSQIMMKMIMEMNTNNCTTAWSSFKQAQTMGNDYNWTGSATRVPIGWVYVLLPLIVTQFSFALV